MSKNQKAMLRSFLTTLVGVFLTLAPLDAVAGGDFSGLRAAGVAALAAALRTILAALDSGNPAFGRGSGADEGYLP